MLPSGAVAVERVWKRFRADRRKQRRAKDLIERIGQRASGRAKASPWRWVLKDIDFAAEPGESIGLVGVNGSGKSTLLKIISGVMFPHSGRVRTGGRVGALIEVVSGIHPDLSGRENIGVYGSLLGLSRRDITRRFDEIVAFAELEDAIDRKVKFYSSGMRMRIGFAIAAFLEPEVLIVDEVLAVGDASFQQKCLERMREVLQSGTTLILVSHDLAAVGAIATRGLWLNDGRLAADGSIDDVLGKYRQKIEQHAEERAHVRGEVLLSDLQIEGPNGALPTTNELCSISFKAHVTEERTVSLFIGVSQGAATPIFVLRHDTRLAAGATSLRLELPHLPLPAGGFFLWFAAYHGSSWKHELSPWQPLGSMQVVGSHIERVPRAIVRLSPMFVEARWTHDG